MSNIQTGAERMPHDLSHLGFLAGQIRSEERFSRNAETDLVCRLLLEKKKNITFHYPYVTTIFTDVLQENWRELKELLRQVRYRRGKAGSAVILSFVGEKNT